VIYPSNPGYTHPPLEPTEIPELLQNALRESNSTVRIPSIEDFYRRYPILRPAGFQGVPTAHGGVPLTSRNALHHPVWQGSQNSAMASRWFAQRQLWNSSPSPEPGTANGGSSHSPGHSNQLKPRIASSTAMFGQRDHATFKQTRNRAEMAIAGIRRLNPRGSKTPFAPPNNTNIRQPSMTSQNTEVKVRYSICALQGQR